MIDGHFKKYQDQFWNLSGELFAKMGFTANGVTILGVILSVVNGACYLYHQNHFCFGIFLILIELLDNVDGAIARVTNTRSAFGAYLDATTDRYKESMMFFAIAFVTDYWILAFIVVTGSIITSYNKARAAMEAKIENENWPDFFERLERIALTCTALVLAPFIPESFFWGYDIFFVTLVILAIGTHISALQRLMRAYRILERVDT